MKMTVTMMVHPRRREVMLRLQRKERLLKGKGLFFTSKKALPAIADYLLSVSFNTQKPFKPPPGFKSVKKMSAPSSNVSSLLSNLRGKQVFHITAPSFLPLSKVKEISLAKVLQGEPILKHEGANYGIPAEDLMHQETGSNSVFLYDAKTETYYPTSSRNVKSYHIQEMVSIPKGSMNNSTPSESVKPPKPQPRHLKMRFRPVGSGNGPPETIGSSSESEGEEPTFKMPKALNREREERKRKHELTEGDGKQAGLPRKKSKKQSLSRDTGTELSSSQIEPVSSQDGERGREKSKKSHKHRNETSEERRTRREQKKRRKSEKASA